MEAQLELIREQQKKTWDTFSPGWKKWDNWVVSYLQPLGDEIIRQLKLKEADQVLDVATGTGEPGLAIASIVKKGKVTGTDISEGMLQVAREKAAARGLKNYDTVACDICELPFKDATFDAISCRLGFMFFPDMEMALREMVRVLKPGGRISAVVWGPPENNFWVGAFMAPIMRIMEVPAPQPGAPGLFRCAPDGLLSKLFTKAGLKNVTQKALNEKGEAESIDFFWTYMNDVAAPVVEAMRKADDSTKLRIKDEIYSNLQNRFPGNGKIVIEYQALVIYGEK